MRLKANIGKPDAMQHRPEAITAANEVVTGGRSGRGRVHQKLGGRHQDRNGVFVTTPPS
jgi:hypothetical protein